MKKKISLFTLLLSMMLVLVVPVQAEAADEKYYDITDFLVSNGYEPFEKKDNCVYLARVYSTFLRVHEFSVLSEYPIFVKADDSNYIYVLTSDGSSMPVKTYKYNSPEYASEVQNFACVSSTEGELTGLVSSDIIKYRDVSTSMWRLANVRSIDNVLYCDDNIYSCSKISETANCIVYYDNVLFSSSVSDYYDFMLWCDDANLNCLASTNELPSVIPYSFNDYWHIVRKTSSGKWLLTTIGNSKDMAECQLRFSEDMGSLIIQNYWSGDDTDSSVNGYKINVRQYEYSSDGWKMRTYDTYDIRDCDDGLLVLGSGTGIDDTRVLAFTSEDIYSFNGYAIMQSASTEYFEPTIEQPTPPEDEVPDTTITPTPTTVPGNGSGGNNSSGAGRPGSGTRPDTGGQATGGGGLDFIINLFTLIWTKICSIPMAVDGYSISLQQIIIYGALVSIVGGFIMHFIFGRK